MRRQSNCLILLSRESGELGLVLLDPGDGGVEGLLSGVDALEGKDLVQLLLVLGESGNLSNGVWLVGRGDGLVLPDDQLLLGGEGGQVHLGAGQGHGGEEKDRSYGLHHLENDSF